MAKKKRGVSGCAQVAATPLEGYPALSEKKPLPNLLPENFLSTMDKRAYSHAQRCSTALPAFQP
jgi:hypothetical protein